MSSKKTKGKYMFDLLRSIEDGVINFVLSRYLKRIHKKRRMLGVDKISPEYKKEIRAYWKPYVSRINTDWHCYYSSHNGVVDVRYIPGDLYSTKIDQHFNNKRFSRGVNDKNYNDIWFPNVKQPLTVARKINDIYYDANYDIIKKDDVISLCMKCENLVIKPAVGSGKGRGIVFWNIDHGDSALREVIFEGCANLVIQAQVRQHKDLSMIHASSLNTVRAITLLINDEVHLLSAVLRMGINGSSVDNESAGGIHCGIEESGQLKDVAYSVYGEKYDTHPQGFRFSNCIVPSYDRIRNLVLTEQKKLAHFRLISWDVAVDEDGTPVLIEANMRDGSSGLHQIDNGPLFGDLTEDVLKEVFLD